MPDPKLPELDDVVSAEFTQPPVSEERRARIEAAAAAAAPPVAIFGTPYRENRRPPPSGSGTHGVDCDLAATRQGSDEHPVWYEPSTGEFYQWRPDTDPKEDRPAPLNAPGCPCCRGPYVISPDTQGQARWRCRRCQPR